MKSGSGGCRRESGYSLRGSGKACSLYDCVQVIRLSADVGPGALTRSLRRVCELGDHSGNSSRECGFPLLNGSRVAHTGRLITSHVTNLRHQIDRPALDRLCHRRAGVAQCTYYLLPGHTLNDLRVRVRARCRPTVGDVQEGQVVAVLVVLVNQCKLARRKVLQRRPRVADAVTAGPAARARRRLVRPPFDRDEGQVPARVAGTVEAEGARTRVVVDSAGHTEGQGREGPELGQRYRYGPSVDPAIGASFGPEIEQLREAAGGQFWPAGCGGASVEAFDRGLEEVLAGLVDGALGKAGDLGSDLVAEALVSTLSL